MDKAMKFIRKNLSNILFIGFIIFLFTPYGLPVRATLIKGVSMITTRVFSLEVDTEDQVNLDNYNWQLRDLDGKITNMQIFQDQVVVVNFWATWCPPCVAEMPSFQKLYDAYGDKVIFLFVANDEEEKVLKFLKKKGYEIPVFFQASRVPDALSSNSLPTTYILDKEGKIVVNQIGAVDWNSGRVRELLDTLIQ
jgi:thiol-disulfide isomerase/thioredoxin